MMNGECNNQSLNQDFKIFWIIQDFITEFYLAFEP